MRHCLIALAIFALASPGVQAGPLYYTFTGTVTQVQNQVASRDNQVNPNDYVSVGQDVTYVFEINFDLPGLHTNWNDQTFVVPDLGTTYDYFYADLLESSSGPTLPVPVLDAYNDTSMKLLEYGENFNYPEGPWGSSGYLYANSRYNEFRVFTVGAAVDEWTIGSGVSAQSRALIWLGNDTYFDYFNASLTLTDISATPPGAAVPDPGSTLLLFGLGLVALRAWRDRRG